VRRAVLACAHVLALALSSGCADRTAAARGEALFSDPSLAGSSLNAVSCATCHSTGDDPRLLAGGSLRGVVARPSYWGGSELDLRAAIEDCLYFFMRAPVRDALPEGDGRGRDLLAYLDTLGDAPATAVPFTVPPTLPSALAPGDAARGAALYDRGCRSCHGAPHTGAGAPSPLAPVVPEATIAEHGSFAPQIVVAKIRHGGFYGIGGAMPPFSVETASDQDLADLVAALGL